MVFLSFAKIIRKVSIKNSVVITVKELFGHAKQSMIDVNKTTLERVIYKTGDFLGNKIANKITRVSPWSAQEPALQTDEKSVEIPKEKYI